MYTSGKTTSIIKTFDEDWDEACKARVYDMLQFNDNESNIADAICFASLHQDCIQASKVEKTIFVITDGYPTTPSKLRMSIDFASKLNITVIALGVGFSTDGIFEYFPNHIVVNNPKDLPKAVKGYYCNEPSPSERKALIKVENVESITHKEKKMNLANAWEEFFTDVYSEEVAKLNTAICLATASSRRGFNTFQLYPTQSINPLGMC